ncbi:MAG: hypothetical protein WCP96_22210 [Methylococcaceae bacterium]
MSIKINFIYRFILLAILFAGNCCSNTSTNNNALQNQPEPNLTPSKLLPQLSSNGLLAHKKMPALGEAELSHLKISVKIKNPGDLKVNEFMTQNEMIGGLLGSTILTGGSFGALALPLVAAYGVGGLIVTPSAFGIEGYRENQLKNALIETDLPILTQNALQRHLANKIITNVGDNNGRLAITIVNYGFSSTSNNRACVFLDAAMKLEMPNMPVYEDKITIGDGIGQDDSPPAFCTHAKRFVSDNAKLARQSLSDLAEILAAIVVYRLNGN